jgi:hypothetical protein
LASSCFSHLKPIAVVLPQLVEACWWERQLHTHRERHLRTALLRHGGPDLATLAEPRNIEAPKPG